MSHFKTVFKKSLICAVSVSLITCSQQKKSYDESFVQVSRDNSSYFCLSNGDSYVPIGLNICWARNMEILERYFKALSENGGNFARIWVGWHSLFEYESVYGQVDEEKIANVDKILEVAGQYGIKVKLCLENFRGIQAKPGTNIKAPYHLDNGGPFTDMNDYMTDDKGKNVFLERVRFFRDRYGDDPRVFAWEIWNEMSAIWIDREKIDADLVPWTVAVLSEMRKIFPHNLVVQNLGSLDRESSIPFYKRIMEIPVQDFTQVHRYIDEGMPEIKFPVVRGPVDVMAADAIVLMQSFGLNKPILLAEVGAVQPNHTGPHRHLRKDIDGIFLHDGIFAPYFTGPAGSGQNWWWDNYVDRNNLWYHFRRFSNAIGGVDPIKEGFEPLRADQPGFRVYVLKGRNTSLIWARDSENSWMAEFGVVEGDPTNPPRLCSGVTLNLGEALKDKKISKVEVYDPWTDQWTDVAASIPVALPDFKRSIVVKIKH